MFGWRSLPNLKQVFMTTMLPSLFRPLSKHSSLLSPSKTPQPHLNIINPNVMAIINLREIILKSKSQN
jgi:hypothetical protein